MKKRRGNLNGEMAYVRDGLAAPWSPEEVETMRIQAFARSTPTVPVLADLSAWAESAPGAVLPASVDPSPGSRPPVEENRSDAGTH